MQKRVESNIGSTSRRDRCDIGRARGGGGILGNGRQPISQDGGRTQWPAALARRICPKVSSTASGVPQSLHDTPSSGTTASLSEIRVRKSVEKFHDRMP